MTINFDGISDDLATTLAKDLDLFRRKSQPFSTARRPTNDNDEDVVVAKSPQISRALLAEFVRSHPEAERSVSRLVLKHLGISRSVLRPQRLSQRSCIAHDGPLVSSERENNNAERVGQIISSRRSPDLVKQHDYEDVIPALSPVPWLSQAAWDAMSYAERVELMELVILGLSHPSALVRYRLFRSTSKYCDSFVMFGRGGVDRVVLGSGPRHVLVIVGIHGNEACGVEAARLILQRHQLFVCQKAGGGGTARCKNRGGVRLATNEELGNDDLWSIPLDALFEELTIEFIVGNPRAVEAEKRFMERNLNRLLDVHILCDDRVDGIASTAAYEVQRARILVEAIRHSDAVLDIHSVSSDSDPFAIPASTDTSEEMAARLPVSYVVQSLAHCTAEGGTTMDCALLHGVPGACVECGQHHHPDIVARAADVISTFLLTQYSGDLSGDEEKGDVQEIVGECDEGPVVMRCEGIEIVRDGFEFVEAFQEFQFIPFGAPVFRDNVQGEVCCPIEPGAYLVMPTKIPVPGEEALSWARAV